MLLVIALMSMGIAEAAPDACPGGQRQLNDGEPCIPEVLFNYLYCLSKSGGGKIEVGSKTENSNQTSREIKLGGKGSGVIISGSGAGSFRQDDASRAVREISERIDPSLATKCEGLARSPVKLAPKIVTQPESKLKPQTPAQQEVTPISVVDDLSVNPSRIRSLYAQPVCVKWNRDMLFGCSSDTLESCNKTLIGSGQCVEKPKEIHCYARSLDPTLQCYVSLQRCQSEIDSDRESRNRTRSSSPRLSPRCESFNIG